MHGSSRQGSARPASRGNAPAAAGPKDSTAARPRGSAPAAAGPADAEQLTRLLQPVVTAAGMDLENIRITATGRRRLLRVTVDADNGVSLDDITLISRTLSAELDAIAIRNGDGGARTHRGAGPRAHGRGQSAGGH